MFVRLLLLFTIVPLTELLLLIEIGERIGPIPTIALVLFTGTLGAWLAKSQGVKTWLRIQQEWSGGKIPTETLLEGLLILVAGAVLLTPGILTDLAGFFLLTPWGRGRVRTAVASYFRRRAQFAQAQAEPQVIIIDRQDPSI